MLTQNVMNASALLILVCGLNGCADSDPSHSATESSTEQIEKTEQVQNMRKERMKMATQSLIVSKRDDSEQLVRIGELSFNDSNLATLATQGSGTEVEELQRAWEEVSKRQELIWKQSVPDEINGKRITRVIGEKLAPGDPNYIYAVLDTLERKYGYDVELEE